MGSGEAGGDRYGEREKEQGSEGRIPMINEEEGEKAFWLSRPDGWVVNRKMKRIVLLEFKRLIGSMLSRYEEGGVKTAHS